MEELELGKQRATGAILVAVPVLLAAGWASAQHHGHSVQTTPPADTRELVKLPPPMVAHMLANMRDHLQALGEINAALAAGRHEEASKVAEQRLGMSSLATHGAHHMAAFMPKGMQDAGTLMHRSASRFAIEAGNAGVTGDLRPALSALAGVMNACVGCHAGYRVH
jgi:hypothetical protein